MASNCPITEARRSETWVMKQNWASWENKPTKEERREMQETIRNAKPSEVGGILTRMMGARESAEREKRMRFMQERRTLGKEQELLRLEAEAAIFVLLCVEVMNGKF